MDENLIIKTFLLERPLAVLRESIRNAKKLYFSKMTNLLIRRKLILKKMKQSNLKNSDKIVQELDNLIDSTKKFSRKMIQLEKKIKISWKIIHFKRLLFDSNSLKMFSFVRPEKFLNEMLILDYLARNDLPFNEIVNANSDLVFIVYFCGEIGIIIWVPKFNTFFKIKKALWADQFKFLKKLGEIQNELKKNNYKPAFVWCDKNKSKLKKIGVELKLELKLFKCMSSVETKGGFVKRNGNVFECNVIEQICNDLKNETFFAEKSIRYLKLICGYDLNDGSLAKRSFCAFRNYFNSHDRNKMFESAFLKANGVSSLSTLELLLRLGIGSLRTNFCGKKVNDNCPVCCLLKRFKIDDSIPFEESIIRCPFINGNPTKELVASNFGRIYSLEGTTKEMNRVGSRMIQCPYTGKFFSEDDIKKVFLT